MKYKSFLLFFILEFQYFYTYADSTYVTFHNFHYGPITQIELSPDDTKLLTTSIDGSIRLWDISSGKLLHLVNLFDSEESTISFSPDGTKYIVCPQYSAAFVVATNTGKRLYFLEDKSKDPFSYRSSFVWSPDGSIILSKVITYISTLEIPKVDFFDGGSGKKKFSFSDTSLCILWKEFHNGTKVNKYFCNLKKVNFSPDGKLAMLYYSELGFRKGKSCIVIINTENYKEVYRKYGETFENFSNSGLLFITSDCHVFDSYSGNLIYNLKQKEYYRSIEFLPGDSAILLCNKFNKVIIDISSSKVVRNFVDSQYVFIPVLIYKDMLFAASDFVKINQWNWKTGELIKIFKNESEGFIYIQLSNSGKMLLNLSQKSIKIISIETGKILHQLLLTYSLNNASTRPSMNISELCFNREKKQLFIHTKDNRLTKIDLINGKIKRGKRFKPSKFEDYTLSDRDWYYFNDTEIIYFILFNNQIIFTSDLKNELINIWLEGKKDWFISDSNGNYNGSWAMRKKIYFVQNNIITNSRKLKKRYRNKTFWIWQKLINQ